MKQALVLIVAAILMVAGSSFASAKDKCSDSNPCADKEKCVKLGDTDKQCRRICCNAEQCSGEVCYRRYCVTAEEKAEMEKYYGKQAAAANAAALKDAQVALEAANAALRAAGEDAEKIRVAMLAVLAAEHRLADLDLTIARVESGEATKTWLSLTTEATKDGAGDLHSKWDTLKAKREALEGKISALTGAMATADGIVKGQVAKLETIQAALTDLQAAHGNLKVALSDLQAAHKAILGEEEHNFETQLDAEREKTKAAKAEATGLRPHEVGLLGYFFNFLPSEHMEDDHAMVAFARLYWRYHFLLLSKKFRPFVGGGVESGALPDGRGYMGPALELGFRAGNPSELMFFELWGDAGWRIGFYKGSGNHWFAGAGLGPGFNLPRGSLVFGPCYTSSMPGFDGTGGASYEDNFVGVCLRGSGSAGDPE